MLLVIDNYDSFTYNLVQYLGEMGQEVRVVRNDEIPAAEIATLAPSHIVISPGPCTPNEAGISLEVIKAYAGKIPILGVCLGHQAIGQAFGGKVVRAARVMHGKTSPIFHDGKGLFTGLPNPFEATRYHSLLIERASVPDCLDVTAKTSENEIMAVRHKTLPVEGVQFHPESFLTTSGKDLLRNFIARGRPAMTIREALGRVIDRQNLTADQMAAVVGEIMDGQATPAQIGGLLVALRMKGETVDEIVGAARAMRARMVGVDFVGDPIIDTCGTGGDGSRSINVSTIAAFLVAGAGVVVAKHGNRAQSSRSGSHDVIEALGLDPAPSPETAARCLREAKLAFLFAPAHHAATRHVGAPRKEVGVRTIFNLLGPLTNPCGAKFHVNGIFSRERCEILAEAHGALGSTRAMVVHGAGGLDEFAPAGSTFVAELANGRVRTHELAPADFALDESDPAGLRGGEPADNARIALEILRGGGPEAARNATLMTAGAAIYVAGAASDLRVATTMARGVLTGGGGLAVLETLRRIAPRPAPAS